MEKTLKRTLSVLTAAFMTLALSATAFASSEASGEASGGGPASLTWEESAAISRESAEVYVTAGQEESVEGLTIESDADDYTAVFAEGGTLTVTNTVISTTGREAQSPNTTMHFADANFYGTAAAVLASDGAALTVSDSTITTTGEGANAVFTYGGDVTLSDVTIVTGGKENAHGIDAVTAGSITGEGLYVYTAGINSGAAATDTGGGTIMLSDSTLAAAMSPGVYMDGDGVAALDNVTVTVGFDRDGSAVTEMYVTNSGMDGVSDEMKENTAEGLVLTGNAAITAVDTDVTAPYGVKFHSQSATEQVGVLTMTGGSITSTAYDVLYVTGANGSAVLDGVDCTAAEGRYLIRVCNLVPANLAEEGVGEKICAGTGDFTLQNGIYTGDVWALNAEEEETWGAQIDGASRYDNALTLTLSDAAWSGRAIHVNTLTVGAGAVWTVTGESDVASLTVAEDGQVIVPQGYTVTVNGAAVETLSAGNYENVQIICG